MMAPYSWRIRQVNKLAVMLDWVADKLTHLSQLLKRCPDCGENLWYGKACPNRSELT